MKEKNILNLLTELAGDNSSEMSKLYCKKKEDFRISNIESVSDNRIFKILLIKSLVGQDRRLTGEKMVLCVFTSV